MNRPNVILFVAHDTGRHVSPYGIKTLDTPNFERLAQESALFENSFCSAPQCSPSRAGIVTGRYPHANGTLGLTHSDFGWGLHDTERPIGVWLKEAGYATWSLGSTHETSRKDALGFDRQGPPSSVLQMPEALTGLLDSRDPARPFYCQLGSGENHRPYHREGTQPDDRLGVHVPPYLVDGPETRKEMAQLQGLLKRFDAGIGGILDLIDERGLREDTLLIVTTDHGLALPLAKSTLFDPGIETMLFVRWPERFAGGRRHTELVSNVDILPTVLEAAGLPAPGNLHGRSSLPLLEGRPYQEREAVCAEKTFHDSYDPMRCVRTRDHKYIRYFERSTLHEFTADSVGSGPARELGRVGRPEAEALYDLRNDPVERENLADSPAHREIRDTLRARLYRWMVETSDPLLNGPVPSPFFIKGMREFIAAGERAAEEES